MPQHTMLTIIIDTIRKWRIASACPSIDAPFGGRVAGWVALGVVSRKIWEMMMETGVVGVRYIMFGFVF